MASRCEAHSSSTPKVSPHTIRTLPCTCYAVVYAVQPSQLRQVNYVFLSILLRIVNGAGEWRTVGADAGSSQLLSTLAFACNPSVLCAGTVRSIQVNDEAVGRSVDEILRLIQAFDHADKHGEVCPSDWKPGSKTMKPDPVNSQAYFSQLK